VVGGASAGAAAGVALAAVAGADATWWTFLVCSGAGIEMVVGVLVQVVTGLVLNRYLAS